MKFPIGGICGGLIASLLAVIAGCSFGPPEDLPDQLILRPANFADLPGWDVQPIGDAVVGLTRSCAKLQERGGDERMGDYAGTVADWRAVCARLGDLDQAGDPQALRAFFERWFQPFSVANNESELGLFTGYFEPSLNGSRTRSDRYSVPLYQRPEELVMVNLGDFRPDLKGRRIAGQVVNGRLRPFHDRGAIEDGALQDRGLEILWVDDPVDLFFLQIQGSGRVHMADGTTLRVGYAAQNGHPYFAIGRDLIASGEIAREDMSMDAIRDWIAENPEAGVNLMRKNASYVFFRDLDGDGPIGAGNVVLTPGHSLAVDRKWHAMGLPFWLSVPVPTRGPDGNVETRMLQRLMVAQDTGGAIRGPVRGDIFWGHGVAAAFSAGHMKHEGKLWVLLPRSVVLTQNLLN